MIHAGRPVPGPPGRTRRVLVWLTMLLGAVLLVAGMLAGYVNHTALDGPTFAAKVDNLRQVDPVSQALGRSLADRYIASRPDLVALRPLVSGVASSVVGSSALSGPTRSAAGSFQRAATQQDADALVLRIADVGAVLTSALQRAAPDDGTTASASIPVELASFGAQSWAGQTIKAARSTKVGSWAGPLAGVTLLALSIALAPGRRRATVRAAVSVLVVTTALSLLLVAGGRFALGQDEQTVSGALVKYGWVEFVDPFWWWLGALALLALMVLAAAAALLPEFDAGRVLARAGQIVARRPRTFGADLVRSVLFVVAGLAVLISPTTSAAVIAVAVGAALLLYGMAELARATTSAQQRTRRRTGAAAPARSEARREARHVPAVLTVAVVLLLAAGAYGAWLVPTTPASATSSSDPVTGQGQVCDGFAALCDRPFNEVTFAASHNSMSVAGQPGWFLGEQGVPITAQLDNGVRALLVDVWKGTPRADSGVATARESYAEALAIATRELGPQTVAAGLRVFNTLADPTPAGPARLYMCHGLCELGATDFTASMTQVRHWLDAHPDETVSIIIEDHAAADEIGGALTSSGLAAR